MVQQCTKYFGIILLEGTSVQTREGRDVLATAPLDSVVRAEDHRTGRGEGVDQRAQQQAGRLASTPASAAEAGDAQEAGHGALAGRQDGPDE
ncbi:hypothetical protein BB934_27900 (plasmid) [Microvirga ossetica]|uniref:Uncharacterized protein n=1 Tax=Microvirga ossetica TaxID=1882682 RepID=A0A1B2EQD9_9HYPH|nr:hypothetical protein BB934_27900 [Microvirga ossetica]